MMLEKSGSSNSYSFYMSLSKGLIWNKSEIGGTGKSAISTQCRDVFVTPTR